jgi:hypothetical protein
VDLEKNHGLRDTLRWVLVAHACDPSYSGDRSGGSHFEASPGRWYVSPKYLEKTQHKKTELEEWLLPSKPEAMSSKPSAAKKKEAL